MSSTLILPPNPSILTRIRVGVASLAILKDDMANPYYARLLHLSFDGDTYARIAQQMRTEPDGDRLLSERKTIPGDGVEIASMAALPSGTLGQRFAQYYVDNEIEPFTFAFPLADDADFLNKRYRETHDIHHIVTGYGIDDLGEVELQAFYWGNLGFRHAAFISLVYIPRHLFTEGFRGLGEAIRRLRAAYRRGRAARMILGVPFDELWDRPVEEVSVLVCGHACR